MRTGRVTRVAEFGAFVELEPGIEGLAHASTFAPTGRSQGWSAPVAAGMTAAFEILSIDLEKKRIGVALVPEGSARAGGDDAVAARDRAGRAPHGKGRASREVRRVRVPGPGRTGLIPIERDRRSPGKPDVARAFPVGADVEVVVLEVDDPPGRRIRLSVKAVLDAHEAAEVRETTEREDAAPAEGLRIARRQAPRRAQAARSDRSRHAAHRPRDHRRVFGAGGGDAQLGGKLGADTYPRQPGIDARHYAVRLTLLTERLERDSGARRPSRFASSRRARARRFST